MSSEAGVASGGFAETGEYLRFTEFLASCVRYRYVGVCVGPPGVGKTLSAEHYSLWDVLEPLFRRYAYTRKPPPEVASCRSVFYTAPVSNSPSLIAGEVERRRNLVSWLVDAAGGKGRGRSEPGEIPDHTELLIVDEANRLKVTALEQLRDMYDRDGFGLVLLGMPGLEKSLARYPQLYSRVGFVHRFHALGSEEARSVITERAHLLGVSLAPAAFADGEAVASIVRITGGNFRLMQRLLQQVERVLAINDLDSVTPEAVEAAREALVIGAA
jgi:DNA transposition AAA+ family ATPase